MRNHHDRSSCRISMVTSATDGDGSARAVSGLSSTRFVSISSALVPSVTCAACGTANEAGRKFCGECGTPLAQACPACGAANSAGRQVLRRVRQRRSSRTPRPTAAPRRAAVCRRAAGRAAPRLGAVRRPRRLHQRLGATRRGGDARAAVAATSRAAARVIERYGGTVEKFIGDAVMAVWGAPDRAGGRRRAGRPRGARAPLDGARSSTPTCARGRACSPARPRSRSARAPRAWSPATSVNTASRIQSAAEPGTVLVGESTKRATEAAIAYEDAGVHELKGKAEPVQLWRALRVVAGSRGAMRSAGLEAPFVGRDRELRLVKELFHATADEKRAQLVLVSGIAGIGKSRLAWEFEKYVDGLAARHVFWHRGRCLSYGEGVAYWALAEMVRMRCGIAEDEAPAAAREKLKLALSEYILDADERAWVEPRLAHLLGLEEGAPGDQENLFSAWRILFERLAEVWPTILVFEDLQWADAGLLDFLEYLLDWSRSHQLYVRRARPARVRGEARDLGRQARLHTALPRAARRARDGGAAHRPRPRAPRRPACADPRPRRGRPAVRRGDRPHAARPWPVTREGDVYRPTGADRASWRCPRRCRRSSPHASTGSSPRSAASSRTARCSARPSRSTASARLAGLDAADLDPLLASLLRKEILAVQADPLSPERGQYSFLQDIVKQVAYDTLARNERKAKHLAAAEYLAGAYGDEDEVIEVVAAHYVSALEAVPDAPDARELRDTGVHDARSRGRAGRLARRQRGGPACVRARCRAHRGHARAGGASRARGRDGAHGRPRRGVQDLLRARDRPLRRCGRDPRGRTRRGSPRGDDVGPGPHRGRARPHEPLVRAPRPRASPTTTSPRLRRSSAASSSSAAIGTRRWSGSRRRSRWPRASSSRTCSRRR